MLRTHAHRSSGDIPNALAVDKNILEAKLIVLNLPLHLNPYLPFRFRHKKIERMESLGRVEDAAFHHVAPNENTSCRVLLPVANMNEDTFESRHIVEAW